MSFSIVRLATWCSWGKRVCCTTTKEVSSIGCSSGSKWTLWARLTHWIRLHSGAWRHVRSDTLSSNWVALRVAHVWRRSVLRLSSHLTASMTHLARGTTLNLLWFFLSSSLHLIYLELLLKLIFSESCVCDIRVSLEHLDSFLESFQSSNQWFSLLSNALRLSKRLCHVLILVDLRVKLKLESLLRRLNEEISNRLGNSVSYVSHSNLEVGVYSCSDFSHEHIGALAHVVLSLRSLLLWLSSSNLYCCLAWLLLRFLLRDNVCPIGEIVTIVSEKIVLFSINDLFH